MLIKIEEGTVINMTGIRSILIREVKETKTESYGFFGLFSKEVEVGQHWNLEIMYINDAGKPAQFTLTHIQDVKQAMNTQNELLRQIKEVELESVSTLLEEAIKNG